MAEILLRNGRLLSGESTDVLIKHGRITQITPELQEEAETIIDLAGKLILPAFVNGQLHACKSFWRRLVDQLPPDIRELPRFEMASYAKALYTAEDVFRRVDEVMRLAIQNGTCAIRLFADVDESSEVAAIEGLLAIKQKYRPYMTVQVVAFPQDGVLNPTTQHLMEQALLMGADVVGGIPWIEPDITAQKAHTDMCYALAQRFDRDLHFVCDDAINADLRTLAYVAEQAVKTGRQNRVAATQCAALSAYDDDYAAEVVQAVKEAGITIFSNSHVSLIATDFDEAGHPWPRGLTRIRALLEAGVNVACGQDDIDNWFYPFGRNDMLEVAQFMAHNGRFAWQDDINKVLPMVTDIPARVLNVSDYGLAPGRSADIVVLNAPDWHQAIQFQPEKSLVILRGRIVARSERYTDIMI